MEHKFSTYALISLGVLLILGGVSAGLFSEDIDDICNLNNMTLYRSDGNWMCGNLSQMVVTNVVNNISQIILHNYNPFDQSLNKSSNVEHKNLILTGNILTNGSLCNNSVCFTFQELNASGGGSGMNYINIAMLNKSNNFGVYTLTASVVTGASQVSGGLVKSTNSVEGFAMKDGGSVYYTRLRMYPGTPYNTQDRMIYFHPNNADRIINLKGDLQVQGNVIINQSLTQKSNIKVQNISANNVTATNLYVSGKVGDSTKRYTWEELNASGGGSATGNPFDQSLNKSSDVQHNHLVLTGNLTSKSINPLGGNVTFFSKSTTGTGSTNGDFVHICNPAENRCGRFYIDQYGRLVISIPNDDISFQANSVTIEGFNFDATTISSASDVVNWKTDTNKNGEGIFNFYSSEKLVLKVRNLTSTFYNNITTSQGINAGNFSVQNTLGFTGSCINTQFKGGIAIACNDD